MKKRFIFLLIVLTFVITGCFSEKNKEQKTVINYWVWLDNPNDPTLKNLISQYNSENKDVEVKLDIIPWSDYRNKLLTSVINGEGPDIASFKLTWMPEFTANSYLEPLNSYIDKWKGKEDIDSNLWKHMTTNDGNIYALPWEIQVLYMYYRPSLFKAANVEIPRTWDEFLEVSKQLTKDTNGDGIIDQYAFAMRGARYGHEPWGSFVFANVKNNKIMENDKVVFDTPEARKANEFFINLFKKDQVVPPTAPTDGFAQIISNFKTGKTAMVVHHIKSSKEMVETFGDDVNAFAVPQGTHGRWTSMGDTENVMFKTGKHKEEAFKFISWLAEAKQIDVWCKATGNVPVVKSLRENEYYKNNRFMSASFESFPFANIYPINKNMGEWIELVWPTTIQRALLGEITADQAFDELVEGMKKQ